jgi:hypothetical protein
VGQPRAVDLGQPVAQPRAGVVGAIRDEQEDRPVGTGSRQVMQQLEALRVAPVDVLHEEQQRLARRDIGD